jgi:hypothetical protein
MRAHVGGGGDPRVAGGLELAPQVAVVLAGAARALRQEVPPAAAHQHAHAVGRALVEELRGDPRPRAAIARVDRVAGGRRVGDVGGRHDAHVETGPARASQQLAEVFDARVVERIGGVVGEDAGLVVGAFRAGDVGRHAGRRVRDERVERVRHHLPGDRHRVHGQGGADLAVGHAPRSDPGRAAMGRPHAVAEQQDHVAGIRHAGRTRLPGIDGEARLRAGRARFGADEVRAGRIEGEPALHERAGARRRFVLRGDLPVVDEHTQRRGRCPTLGGVADLHVYVEPLAGGDRRAVGGRDVQRARGLGLDRPGREQGDTDNQPGFHHTAVYPRDTRTRTAIPAACRAVRRRCCSPRSAAGTWARGWRRPPRPGPQ